MAHRCAARGGGGGKLEDSDWRVRKAAVETLGKLMAHRSRRTLRRWWRSWRTRSACVRQRWRRWSAGWRIARVARGGGGGEAEHPDRGACGAARRSVVLDGAFARRCTRWRWWRSWRT